MTERELIQKLKNDDRKAFDAAYSMYARRLMAWCMQYVTIREDAEEMVQDVFIALWHNRAAIRNPESLQPLLFTSLRNRMTNAFRSRINSPVYEDFVNARNSLDHTAAPAYDSLEYKEFYQRIMKAIGSLPRSQRQIVTLSRIHGLTNQEIAVRLGLSDQTVRNTLHNALRTLRMRIAVMISVTTLCIINLLS
ncbi:MAG: RNA polymerase sigma-70 factor [Muribaculaceae bacterium]|nr:RNA polymerase sigma-70 factor [Muribaculaceae bacterium]